MLRFWSYYPVTHRTTSNAKAIDRFATRLRRGDYHLQTVACSNCGRSDDERLFSNDRYGIPWSTVVCRNCGLVYCNPRFDEASNARFYGSDDYRIIYSSDLLADPSFRYRFDDVDRTQEYHRLSYYDFITSALQSFDSVAEIGAAGGWNLVPFIKDGKDCVGYDFSPALVEAGRKRGINMVLAGDAGMEGKYDVIMLRHTLEHLLDPVGQLRELRSHLTDRGHIFIEIPGFLARMPSIQNAHTHYFSPSTLRSVMTRAGYAISRMKTTAGGGGIIFALAAPARAAESVAPDRDEYRRVKRIVRQRKVQAQRFRLARLLPPPIRKAAKAALALARLR